MAMVPNSAPPCAGFDAFGMPWESDGVYKRSAGELEIIVTESLRDDPQLRHDLHAAEEIYAGALTFEEKFGFRRGFVIARLGEGKQS